jgi:hypothetical protein
MADATSSCAKAWGQCLRDARCADTACEGHPTIGCSACRGGPCPTPQACHLPILQLQPIRRHASARRRLIPANREAWGRAIGALLGFGGFVLFAGSWLRQFFL